MDDDELAMTGPGPDIDELMCPETISQDVGRHQPLSWADDDELMSVVHADPPHLQSDDELMSPEVGPAPWNGPLRERSVTDSGISFSPKRQSDEAESRKEAERLRDSLTKVDKAVQAEDDTLVDAEGIRCQIIAGFNGCEQPPKPKLKGVARRERSRSPTSLRLLRTPIQSPGLSGRAWPSDA
ncbi:unnamed protein product [Effrenium voratum]|uniref:Uncharacterized protein n=1 Tax=Effrenium voratum TaxID=2562239 RepID=A0AA36J7K9_9DINO|nr:unnamed protein product [Effrenium voratum]